MTPLILVNQPANPIQLYDSDPVLQVHRDCFFVPIDSGNFWENQTWGVYDSDGRLIDAAAFRSLPGMRLTGQNPSCLVDVVNAPYAPRDQYFYVGNIINHYGHFICSSMARLWALPHVKADSIPMLGHAAGGPTDWFSWPFARTLFGSAGLACEDFTQFDHPVRIRQLIVAGPSFVEMNLAHTAHARAAHTWGDRLVKTQDLSSKFEVVYLSKSRYRTHPDGFSNEAELVAVLERAGVRIVHPELLTIPEQIALFRRTKLILGQIGSAFHTSIFSEPFEGQAFVTLVPSPDVYSTNHALMDFANRQRSVYVYFDGVWHEREGGNPGFRLSNPEGAGRRLLELLNEIRTFA